MSITPLGTRARVEYRISEQDMATLLGVPLAQIDDWSWEGQGADGILVVHRAEMVTPDTPISDWDKLRNASRLYRFQDIYAATFDGHVASARFRSVTMTTTDVGGTTYLVFDLNFENED